MCSLLSRDERRKSRVARYVDNARLYRVQAEDSRRMGNPAGAAWLDDLAADCEAVATDILAGRRRP